MAHPTQHRVGCGHRESPGPQPWGLDSPLSGPVDNWQRRDPSLLDNGGQGCTDCSDLGGREAGGGCGQQKAHSFFSHRLPNGLWRRKKENLPRPVPGIRRGHLSSTWQAPGEHLRLDGQDLPPSPRAGASGNSWEEGLGAGTGSRRRGDSPDHLHGPPPTPALGSLSPQRG